MTLADPDVVAPTEAGARRRWLAFSVVLTGAFMDSVDATMMTVMVPTVRADLGASDAVTQWMLAGYLLAFAMLLVAGGRCGDVLGKRRTFVVGATVFGLASGWCGVVTSGEALVLGRVVQGLGAAAMVPQAAALVTTLFPRREWPAAFGVFGAVLSVGSVCGPLVGGLLTAADLGGLGWRTAFLVNVPVCVVAVGAARLIPEDRSTPTGRLDLVGVVLSSATACALLVPLVNGRETGWPWWSFVMLLAAVPAGVAFWSHQRRLAARGGMPLVPPRLFAGAGFGGGLLVVLVVYMAVTSCFLVVTLVLQDELGWSIVRTAMVTAAWPLGIVATFQVGWRAGAGRERLLLQFGCLVMAAGVLVLAAALHAGADVPTWRVVAGLATLGAGMGLTSPVLTARVLGRVPVEDNGAGSGVLNAVVQLGGAVGVAVLGALFFLLAERHEPGVAGSLTLGGNAVLLVLAAALSATTPTQGPDAPDGGDA